MKKTTRTITQHESGQRLDRFLKKHFPNVALSGLYKLIRTKDIRVNEKKSNSKYMLQEGDTLQFRMPPHREIVEQQKKQYICSTLTPFFKKNFHILFEDESFLILDKPGSIAVHPGSKHKPGQTLIDLAVGYMAQKDPEAPPPQLAHRLDLETSGVILLAKNPQILREINVQFKDRQTRKTYLALVQGIIASKKGSIELPLYRTENKHCAQKIIVKKQKGSKTSLTYYEVQKTFEKKFSLLSLELKTGRMHQIRVHLQEIGHPIIGDRMYGDFSFNKAFARQYRLKRHFLHAETLTFVHPLTKKEICIRAPLPEHLQDVLAKL